MLEKTVRPEHRRDTYFIAAHDAKTGLLKAIKIGVCGRGMAISRLRTLQTGSLDKLKLLAVYRGNVERKLHRMFKESRLRPNSEFFRPTQGLLDLIAQLNEIAGHLRKLDESLEQSTPQDVVAAA